MLFDHALDWAASSRCVCRCVCAWVCVCGKQGYKFITCDKSVFLLLANFAVGHSEFLK